MRIKVLLMDADDTVLDFKKSERHALSRLFSALDLPFTEEGYIEYDTVNLAYWKAFERGEITRDALLIKRFDDLKETGLFPRERSSAELNRLYFSFLKDGGYRVKGIGRVLASLSRDGIIVALASNGVATIQRHRLSLAKLAHAFDHLFISEEIGYQKPDARFFAPVFACYPSVPRSEIAIVGDSLSSDIQGGVNAGIKTIWVNRFAEENDTPLTPDAVIDDIRALTNLSAL